MNNPNLLYRSVEIVREYSTKRSRHIEFDFLEITETNNDGLLLLLGKHPADTEFCHGNISVRMNIKEPEIGRLENLVHPIGRTLPPCVLGNGKPTFHQWCTDHNAYL